MTLNWLSQFWGQVHQPSYPLDQIGLALAQLLKRDKYQPATVTLASDLPPFWLSSVDDSTLKHALTQIRGGVTLNAKPRPQESPDYQYQVLMVFLVELENDSTAETLLRLSREKQERPKPFELVAANQGRLFCLAVARSFMAGKPSFETQASMQRFSAGIAAALKDQYPK